MTTGFLADLALDFEFYAISYGVYLAGVIALIALFFLMFSSNSTQDIFNEIKHIHAHVQGINSGEIIMKFSKNEKQCKGCSQRYNCKK